MKYGSLSLFWPKIDWFWKYQLKNGYLKSGAYKSWMGNIEE